MRIEFDPNKNQRNIDTRGLSFELAQHFEHETAIEITQHVDDETRYFALGYIKKRLHALVYTIRNDVLRVISLRKANSREVKKYEQLK